MRISMAYYCSQLCSLREATHRLRAMVVLRLSGGVAPSKTKTGRMRWNNSLRGCTVFSSDGERDAGIS